MTQKWSGEWCAAINCSDSRKKSPHLSFFRFPKDPERCKKWVINTRREDLLGKSAKALNSGSCLCANHFEASQFMNVERRNRLTHQAVPTLFEIPNPPPRLENTRKPPSTKRRKFAVNTSETESTVREDELQGNKIMIERNSLQTSSQTDSTDKRHVKRFPKSEDVRKQWVSAVSRKNWTPTPSSALCSLHFSPEALDKTSLTCVRVRENAVPNVFPAHQGTEKKNRRGLSSKKQSVTLEPKEVPAEVSENWDSQNLLIRLPGENEFVLVENDEARLQTVEESHLHETELQEVCGPHFEEDCITRNYSEELVKIQREIPALTDAVPTIVPNLPSYLSRLSTKRKQSSNRCPLSVKKQTVISEPKEVLAEVAENLNSQDSLMSLPGEMDFEVAENEMDPLQTVDESLPQETDLQEKTNCKMGQKNCTESITHYKRTNCRLKKLLSESRSKIANLNKTILQLRKRNSDLQKQLESAKMNSGKPPSQRLRK